MKNFLFFMLGFLIHVGFIVQIAAYYLFQGVHPLGLFIIAAGGSAAMMVFVNECIGDFSIINGMVVSTVLMLLGITTYGLWGP